MGRSSLSLRGCSGFCVRPMRPRLVVGRDDPGHRRDGPHAFRRANITWRQEVGGSAVQAGNTAGTATGATAGDGASRGSSAGRRPPPSLRKRGGVSSAAPLSSCGTGVLRALFLAKRTSGAVRPCGHRPSEAPRNPPVPFTPLGFRESFASKLPEPSCRRSRMGFPIGTVNFWAC